MVLSLTITYDSHDRVSGTPSNAQFRINSLRSRISESSIAITPVYITLPNIFYNVHEKNNSVIVTENGTPVGFELPVGNYTAITLGTALETALNASTTTAEVYDVVYDTNFLKYTITSTLNSTVLRFVSSVTGPTFFDQIFIRMGYSIQQQGTTLVSENVVNLIRSRYICVQLSIHGLAVNSKEMPLTCTFPLDTGFGEIKTHIFHQQEVLNIYNTDLGTLSIRIMDEFGRLLELPINHSVILCFKVTNAAS